MQNMYYIGLDIHKRTISYCVKDASGRVYAEGSLPATRFDLDRWMKTLPQPWTAAMEATVFTGWIYDHLQPHGEFRSGIKAFLYSCLVAAVGAVDQHAQTTLAGLAPNPDSLSRALGTTGGSPPRPDNPPAQPNNPSARAVKRSA